MQVPAVLLGLLCLKLLSKLEPFETHTDNVIVLTMYLTLFYCCSLEYQYLAVLHSKITSRYKKSVIEGKLII